MVALSITRQEADEAPLDREVDLLRSAATLIEDRLPRGWRLERSAGDSAADSGVDALWRLHAPDGSTLVMIVWSRRQLASRDIPDALQRSAEYEQVHDVREPTIALLISRYLSASTRERIEQRGAGYVDATGNLRIAVERPALFLRDVGAERDPWRGPGRPRDTLKGPAAARVVRALVDFSPPFTVPQLIRISGASTGATYRVVELLERESLIERKRRGAITEVRWQALLDRWSGDYGFQQSNAIAACLQPRGLPALVDLLSANAQLRYVLTGALAIEQELSYAPPRLAMLYVDNLAEAMDLLGLRPVAAGANVLLASTDYDVVYERTQEIRGLRAAAKSQVAVDLLTAPGRGPSEAQALIEWMSTHERSWRER